MADATVTSQPAAGVMVKPELPSDDGKAKRCALSLRPIRNVSC